MNCFCIFKDKLKCKQKAQSAPELEKQDRHGGVGTSISTSNKKSLPEHSLRVFSPQELKKATRGCSTKIKIGGGASGSVYKGTVQLVSGKGAPIPVAVKKLNEHELQGYKDYWLAEVQFLSDVNHPNLVKLLGFCSSENDRGTDLLLVCEHMPNRSLEDHLFNQALPPLPWKTRLEIILGAAEGLAYLHKGMGVKIIYRDFKPANVLLDENFKAKLSVRGGPPYDDPQTVINSVGRTYFHAAPEYMQTGLSTIYSDVWSFGVVLYELLTGRRAMNSSRQEEGWYLPTLVKDFTSDKNKFNMIMDPRLRNDYSLRAARRIAQLAECCLSMNQKHRPSMKHGVSTIKQAIEDTERKSRKSIA